MYLVTTYRKAETMLGFLHPTCALLPDVALFCGEHECVMAEQARCDFVGAVAWPMTEQKEHSWARYVLDATGARMARPLFASNDAAMRAFESQGELAPGQTGWWKVWGARTADIRVGDLVLSGSALHDAAAADYITDTFTAKSAPLRVGLFGESRFTLGALAPVVVMRWGTHNTLA